MTALRRRTQEITAEYWATRETQSERVAVAQLALFIARLEAATPPADDTLLRRALADERERSHGLIEGILDLAASLPMTPAQFATLTDLRRKAREALRGEAPE